MGVLGARWRAEGTEPRWGCVGRNGVSVLGGFERLKARAGARLQKWWSRKAGLPGKERRKRTIKVLGRGDVKKREGVGMNERKGKGLGCNRTPFDRGKESQNKLLGLVWNRVNEDPKKKKASALTTSVYPSEMRSWRVFRRFPSRSAWFDNLHGSMKKSKRKARMDLQLLWTGIERLAGDGDEGRWLKGRRIVGEDEVGRKQKGRVGKRESRCQKSTVETSQQVLAGLEELPCVRSLTTSSIGRKGHHLLKTRGFTTD